MGKVKNIIQSAGKMVALPLLLIFILISIFIFNGFQKGDTSIIKKDGSTFIASSGTVENNTSLISSEVVGTVDELLVSEGDKINKDEIVARINSSNLVSQYEAAESNLKIAQENVKALETSLANFDAQNAALVNQARSGYLAAQSESQKVKEGVSAEEIKMAEATLNQAKANLDFMESNLDKSRQLLDNEIIAQNMYDEAELKYNQALGQYEAAAAQVDLLKSGPTSATINAAENKMGQAKAGYDLSISSGKAQKDQLINQLEIAKIQLEQAESKLNQVKLELDKTEIKSPLDGIINSIYINLGEFTAVGKQVAEIYDPNNIEIKVYVSEKNIGHVKVGQEVEVYADFDENQVFAGEVVRINNVAEFTPKNIQTKEERVNTVFEVKLRVKESDGELKPGMPVDVNIKID